MLAVVHPIEVTIGLKAKVLLHVEGSGTVKKLDQAITVDSLVYSTESVNTDFDSVLIDPLGNSINTLKVRLDSNTRYNRFT